MTSIQTAVNRKRWGDTLWWVPLIIGIACVLLVYTPCLRRALPPR